MSQKSAAHKGEKAASGESKKILTAENLETHEQLLAEGHKSSEDEIAKALAKLPSKDQQLIWKKFERSRSASGFDQEYKECTKGSHVKKNKMLLGWILDKTSCGKHFQDFKISFGISKTVEAGSTWLSQVEALAKYGKQQLGQMVEAGTIEYRRLATDPRFFEFRAWAQSDSAKVTGQKVSTVQSKRDKALTNDDMLAFSSMTAKGLLDRDFDMNIPKGDSSDSENEVESKIHQDLAKALDLKQKPASAKEPKQKKDPLETMSQINKDDNQQAIKDKVLSFKQHMQKNETELQLLLEKCKN